MAAMLAAALLSFAVPGRANAIIGGSTTGALKGQAQIWEENGADYTCTGSIIGARYILTADHCLYEGVRNDHFFHPVPANTLRVFVGNRNLHQGQEIKVDGYTHAPKPPTALYPDVAILHLAWPVSNQNLIVKYSKDRGVLKGGLTVALRGWGLTSTTGPRDPSPRLKVCNMSVGTTSESIYELEPLNGIAYDGDSGAGVWYGGIVHAVFNGDDDDDGPPTKAYATPTGKLADWIKRVTHIDGVAGVGGPDVGGGPGGH